MNRRILCAVLISFFAAISAHAQMIFIPVHVPPPTPVVDAGDYKNIHTVAVLSATGTKLHIGVESLFSDEKTVNIDDWDIDNQVVSTVEQLLDRRFQFKNVSYDREALASIPTGALDDTTSALRKFLGSVPNDGIDAFFIVRPDVQYDAGGGPGLSWVSRDFPVAFANYKIDFVDAHSLKIIGSATSRARLREGPASFAGLVLDKAMAYDQKTKEATPLQRKVLQVVYYRLIPLSLLETIRALQFDTDLPPVGSRVVVARTKDRIPYPQIKTVAIASAIGDQFGLNRLGFSNSQNQMNTEDWDLDGAIEAQAQAAIGKQFTVKNISIDRNKFRDASLFDDRLTFNPKLQGLEPTEDVDAYIVFLKHPFRFRDRPQRAKGAGMLRSGGDLFGLDSENRVYVYYDVALVDARTLKVIRASAAAVDPKLPVSSPVQLVDSSLWAETAEKMTPDKKEKIHKVLDGLLDASVKETLMRMNLTETMIIDSWPLPTENAMEMTPPASL